MKKTIAYIMILAVFCAALSPFAYAGEAQLKKAVSYAENAVVKLHFSNANTEEEAKKVIESKYAPYLEDVRIKDVYIVSMLPAAVTEAERVSGRVEYILELENGNFRATTDILSSEILADTEYAEIIAQSFSSVTGSKTEMKAYCFGFDEEQLYWQVTYSGQSTEPKQGTEYTFIPENEGKYKIDCLYLGRILDSIEISVTSSFIPVTGITVSKTEFTVGESLVISSKVKPENATSNAVTWTIKDDGGTDAVLAGRIIEAQRPGKIILTASVKNGTQSGDFAVDFTFTVKDVQQSETDTSAVASLIPLDNRYTEEIAEIFALAKGGDDIQATSITGETVNKLFTRARKNTPKDNAILSTLKLSYGEGIVSEETVLVFRKEYYSQNVNVMIVTYDGKIAINSNRISDTGELRLKASNPDMIIVYMDTPGTAGGEYTPYIVAVFAALIPCAVLVFARNYIRNKRKYG